MGNIIIKFLIKINTMSELKIDPMNIIDIHEEIVKCIDNPYYFYSNYITVNNESSTTILSEEDFNKLYIDMYKSKK